jgi:creatinine amidohydrolase
MTWAEVGDRLRESKLVVFPTGSVEQHGLHLGVGADWIQAWEIARRVGEKSGATVLPILPYGISAHHDDFPGVITLDPATYQEVILEVMESLNRDGVTHVVFMNGHGGNLGALTGAAKEAREVFGMLCAIVQWWDILERKPIKGNPAEQHAGYAETALTLASRPEAVRMDRAVLSPTKHVEGEIRVLRAGLAEFRDGLVRIPLKTGDVTDTGSMTEADPGKFPGTKDYSVVTEAFAEGLMNDVVDWMCAFVAEFEKFELPPIEVSKEKAMKALRA